MLSLHWQTSCQWHPRPRASPFAHSRRSPTMCCFSRPVQRGSNTQIFVRSAKEGRQFVVYSMLVGAKEDLAMILPLPVPKKTDEEAVKFINLEKYSQFFGDLMIGFPMPGRGGAMPNAF